jgi:hypothetical protein
MSAATSVGMNTPRPLATLEPVRFGEFLLLRNLISDEQWLAALAEHWSASATSRRPIGNTIIANGFLPKHVVEAEARAFHDDIEVVEVVPRSERVTAPIPSVRA